MYIKLSPTQFEKFWKNLLVFLSPVIYLYATSVIALITLHNGSLLLTDFVPNQFVWGSITLYLLNSLLDYLKKRIETKNGN